MVEMKHEWTKEHVFENKPSHFSGPAWPHEALVKVLSSASHSDIASHFAAQKGAKVLEVGSMYANNMRYFSERGYLCTGVEVTDDMVALCKENLDRFGVRGVDVVKGSNRSLPFPDDSFDLLVSINTLHYDHGDGVLAGLREFRRVLKPGGVAFVETAGARHFIRQGAERIGPFEYKPRFGDFRDGGVYGLFDDLAHYQESLAGIFSKAEAGSLFEQYPKRTLEFYFGIAVK